MFSILLPLLTLFAVNEQVTSSPTKLSCQLGEICIINSNLNISLTNLNNINVTINSNNGSVSGIQIYDENMNKISFIDCKEINSTSCNIIISTDEIKLTPSFWIGLDENQPVFIEPEYGLTKYQRRQFTKAHAILMILAWLLFIPTAFLSARFGKDLYSHHTIFGVAVWFQIHRVSNLLGIVCICTSILCIFISTQWTWKGSGSGSKYWTEIHTNLGIIASVLAVAQPFISLLRCGPTHSKRILFNWAHRLIGVAAYTLALTTILIAAIHFGKVWTEPLVEVVLASLPMSLCVVATAMYGYLEGKERQNKVSYGPHASKVPAMFASVGVFFACSVGLSLLVVNGYKS